MDRLQAYKYQLRPNGEQARRMKRFAGSCRFVYNRALALQKELYESSQSKLSYVSMAKQLTVWKHSDETIWLSESPAHPLQQALKDLDRAYQNFFAKRAQFPTFKKRGQKDSFRYPEPKQIKFDEINSRIFLPKLGWQRYRNSRTLQGAIRNATVSYHGGKWYISIQTQRDVKPPIHPKTSLVGLDIGVAKFASLSDGSVYDSVGGYRKNEKRLALLQRRMSKKKRFSSNWNKSKERVQKIHSKISNIRRDYLHKTSTAISQNHAIVVIEDLQIHNMTRSAKGTVANPGRNVRAKSGLNKSILDQGWYEFRRQLQYKQEWLGGQVIAVSPQYTSQRCSRCGYVNSENRTSQARFKCLKCGHRQNADLNAACNILAAGHAVLACGEMEALAHSVKQEPSEAILKP